MACRAISSLGLDLDAALRVWEEAMALPETDPRLTPRWYHGDLLAENLLMRDGHLSAVLDFGGLAVGDPTVDLVVAWEVLDPASREVFRRAIGVDEQTWLPMTTEVRLRSLVTNADRLPQAALRRLPITTGWPARVQAPVPPMTEYAS